MVIAMNRTLPILALLVVSFVLVMPNTSAAAPAWSIETDPPFCYIGDNITIEVRGTPMSYATVIVMPANGTVDESIGEELVQLDFLGNADCNISVSVDTPGGTYRAIVVYDSVERANTTFEVLFDYQIYDTWLTQRLMDDLDEQKALTREYAKETARLADLMEQIRWFALATMAFGGFTCAYVWVNRESWRAWNVSMLDGSKSWINKTRRTFYGLIHPKPHGLMDDLNPGQAAATQRKIEELEAKKHPVEKAFVVLPDDTAGEGFRVYPLKGVDEPAPATPAPAQAPVNSAPAPVQASAISPKRPGAKRAPGLVDEEPHIQPVRVKPLEKRRRFRLPSLFGRKKDVVPMSDEDLYPGLERERPRAPAHEICHEEAIALVNDGTNGAAPARAPARKGNGGKSGTRKSSASKSSSGTRKTSTPRKKPAPKPKEEGEV